MYIASSYVRAESLDEAWELNQREIIKLWVEIAGSEWEKVIILIQ